MNGNFLLIMSLIQHFLFSVMTLMAINKSTTDVPQRPHLHLHHQNQTTCEEWKKTCYNFTTLPILLSKCLINLCQHMYETKIENIDSLTPGVGYRKIVLLHDPNDKTTKLKSRTLAHPENFFGTLISSLLSRRLSWEKWSKWQLYARPMHAQNSVTVYHFLFLHDRHVDYS